MIPDKINIHQKFSLFTDHWRPKIVGELNQQQVKLVKFKGQFEWHQHENEDELFLVIEGSFVMHLREKTITLEQGEMIIIPRGTEHKPEAQEEVHVLLFEPATTLNTGNQLSHFTVSELDKI